MATHGPESDRDRAVTFVREGAKAILKPFKRFSDAFPRSRRQSSRECATGPLDSVGSNIPSTPVTDQPPLLSIFNSPGSIDTEFWGNFGVDEAKTEGSIPTHHDAGVSDVEVDAPQDDAGASILDTVPVATFHAEAASTSHNLMPDHLAPESPSRTGFASSKFHEKSTSLSSLSSASTWNLGRLSSAATSSAGKCTSISSISSATTSNLGRLSSAATSSAGKCTSISSISSATTSNLGRSSSTVASLSDSSVFRRPLSSTANPTSSASYQNYFSSPLTRSGSISNWDGTSASTGLAQRLASAQDLDIYYTLGEKLYGASAGGHLADVKKCIQEGADPSYKTPYLWTSLHWAAHNGHYDVVVHLVLNGAELSPLSVTLVTPLDQSIIAGHSQISHYLRSKGAKRRYPRIPAKRTVEEHTELSSSALLPRKRRSSGSLYTSTQSTHPTAVPELIKVFERHLPRTSTQRAGTIDLQATDPFVEHHCCTPTGRSDPVSAQRAAAAHPLPGSKRDPDTSVANTSQRPDHVASSNKPWNQPTLIAPTYVAIDKKNNFSNAHDHCFGGKATPLGIWRPLYESPVLNHFAKPYTGSPLQTIHESAKVIPKSSGIGRQPGYRSSRDTLTVSSPDTYGNTSQSTKPRDMPFVYDFQPLGTSNLNSTETVRKITDSGYWSIGSQTEIRELHDRDERRLEDTEDDSTDRNIQENDASFSQVGQQADVSNDSEEENWDFLSGLNNARLTSRFVTDTEVEEIIEHELPPHQRQLAGELFQALQAELLVGQGGKYLPMSEVLKTCMTDTESQCGNETGSRTNSGDASPSQQNGDNGDRDTPTSKSTHHDRANKGKNAARDDDISDSDDLSRSGNQDEDIGRHIAKSSSLKLICPCQTCDSKGSSYNYLQQHRKTSHTGDRCISCKRLFYSKEDSNNHYSKDRKTNQGCEFQDEDTGFHCPCQDVNFETVEERDYHLHYRPECDECPNKPYSSFMITLFDESIGTSIEQAFTLHKLGSHSLVTDFKEAIEQEKDSRQHNSPSSIQCIEIWQEWVDGNAKRYPEQGPHTYRELAKWYWAFKTMYPNMDVPLTPFADEQDSAVMKWNLIKGVASRKRLLEKSSRDSLSDDEKFEFHSQCYYFAIRVVEAVSKRNRQKLNMNKKSTGSKSQTPKSHLPVTPESMPSSRHPERSGVESTTSTAIDESSSPLRKRRKRTNDPEPTTNLVNEPQAGMACNGSGSVTDISSSNLDQSKVLPLPIEHQELNSCERYPSPIFQQSTSAGVPSNAQPMHNQFGNQNNLFNNCQQTQINRGFCASTLGTYQPLHTRDIMLNNTEEMGQQRSPAYPVAGSFGTGPQYQQYPNHMPNFQAVGQQHAQNTGISRQYSEPLPQEQQQMNFGNNYNGSFGTGPQYQQYPNHMPNFQAVGQQHAQNTGISRHYSEPLPQEQQQMNFGNNYNTMFSQPPNLNTSHPITASFEPGYGYGQSFEYNVDGGGGGGRGDVNMQMNMSQRWDQNMNIGGKGV